MKRDILKNPTLCRAKNSNKLRVPSHLIMWIPHTVKACEQYEDKIYRNNSKFWDTLSTYHTCPKIWNSQFYYLLMCLKYCYMYSKQCRSWSDATFCGIWSGSTLFAEAYLSQYLFRVIAVYFN